MADLLVLNERTVQPATVKYGSYTCDVAAPLQVKIQVPGGVGTILSVACPEGKAWAVMVHVEIVETDV